MLTLACGPYFSETGAIASLALLLLGKPVTYWFFIMAFRYRVATPRPMSNTRIAVLTAVATVLGLAIVAGEAGAIMGVFGDLRHPAVSWGTLMVGRTICWAALGSMGAGLRGRRLVGWTISGLGIDLAFDVSVLFAFFAGPVVALFLIGAVTLFLVPLFVIGRRPSLKARFLAKSMCRSCGYDLAGNTSGVCPECGVRMAG